MNKLQRRCRYYKLRFLRLKGDPGSIARGVALGTFIGITPTLPLHTVSTLIFAPLLRANIIGAFMAGFLVCNPLTYFLQYYLSWLIGSALTPYDLSWERIKAVLDIVLSGKGYQVTFNALSQLGVDAVIVMCVGGAILAAPFTVVAYLVTFRFFKQRQKKRWANSLSVC
ncbi:MAG: DUF2062 domain-containing protein [Desulfobulbaceae bacterium]|nr:DUF2062 domain-containing protein [Desulfobulbaceae bacterium]